MFAARHIMQVLDSVLGNLKPLWNCNFRAQCLFFLTCTQGISYSSHKSVEFMHSCNTLYVLMVHCFKNSRWEIMINIMRIFFPLFAASLCPHLSLLTIREKDVKRVYLPHTMHLMS